MQSEKLKKLGFNDSVRGARYIDSALSFIENKPPQYIRMSNIYTKLADEFGTSSNNIASGMAYAIKKWWVAVSPEEKKKYFPLNSNIGIAPTNKVFLLTISNEKM